MHKHPDTNHVRGTNLSLRTWKQLSTSTTSDPSFPASSSNPKQFSFPERAVLNLFNAMGACCHSNTGAGHPLALVADPGGVITAQWQSAYTALLVSHTLDEFTTTLSVNIPAQHSGISLVALYLTSVAVATAIPGGNPYYGDGSGTSEVASTSTVTQAAPHSSGAGQPGPQSSGVPQGGPNSSGSVGGAGGSQTSGAPHATTTVTAGGGSQTSGAPDSTVTTTEGGGLQTSSAPDPAATTTEGGGSQTSSAPDSTVTTAEEGGPQTSGGPRATGTSDGGVCTIATVTVTVEPGHTET
ncbi:hypothetical protein P691DRAFT_785275, partial [Macrolepiota fuliginosa MF-IS2]